MKPGNNRNDPKYGKGVVLERHSGEGTRINPFAGSSPFQAAPPTSTSASPVMDKVDDEEDTTEVLDCISDDYQRARAEQVNDERKQTRASSSAQKNLHKK